eukprot:SAG31_NODE_22133_length_533_cov_0.755760_1_plen_31_part_10
MGGKQNWCRWDFRFLKKMGENGKGGPLGEME